jgi:alpha-beta hydrolase superfamily lysophospholipase
VKNSGGYTTYTLDERGCADAADGHPIRAARRKLVRISFEI